VVNRLAGGELVDVVIVGWWQRQIGGKSVVDDGTRCESVGGY
jgi:hypothetical protein